MTNEGTMKGLFCLMAATLLSTVAMADQTQWKELKGKSLAELAADGYQLKTAVNNGDVNSYDYFLQKEGKLALCRDNTMEMGGGVQHKTIMCWEIVPPYER